jgi:hypothetical protein
MTLSRLNGMTRTEDSSTSGTLYEALAGLRDRVDELERALASLRRQRPRNGDGTWIHPLSGPLRA